MCAEVSSSPFYRERSELPPFPLSNLSVEFTSSLSLSSVLYSPSFCDREGSAGRVFRWDYERKSFWTARKIKNTRSPSSKTCSREGNGCITHPWPPIDLLCGTDSVLRESVLNLFFHFSIIIVSSRKTFCHHSTTAINVQNTHLKNSPHVTLAAGEEITSGLVTLCFDIWEQPLVISDLGRRGPCQVLSA